MGCGGVPGCMSVLQRAEGSDAESASIGADVSCGVGKLGCVRNADQLPNTKLNTSHLSSTTEYGLEPGDLRDTIQSWRRAPLADRRPSGVGTITRFKKSHPSLLMPWASKAFEGKFSGIWIYAARRLTFLKVGSPVNIRKVISPRDHISAAYVSWGLDSLLGFIKPSNSGARNPKVPFRVDDIVRPSSARLLMPKSPIFTHQCSGGFDSMRIFCSRKWR